MEQAIVYIGIDVAKAHLDVSGRCNAVVSLTSEVAMWL